MNDVCKILWRFRIPILSVFIALFALDVVLGALRLIVVEAAIFVFGICLGRMHTTSTPAMVAPVMPASVTPKPVTPTPGTPTPGTPTPLRGSERNAPAQSWLSPLKIVRQGGFWMRRP